MAYFPDAPWIGDYYDEYRNRFYQVTDEPEEDDEEEEIIFEDMSDGKE